VRIAHGANTPLKFRFVTIWAKISKNLGKEAFTFLSTSFDNNNEMILSTNKVYRVIENTIYSPNFFW